MTMITIDKFPDAYSGVKYQQGFGVAQSVRKIYKRAFPFLKNKAFPIASNLSASIIKGIITNNIDPAQLISDTINPTMFNQSGRGFKIGTSKKINTINKFGPSIYPANNLKLDEIDRVKIEKPKIIRKKKLIKVTKIKSSKNSNKHGLKRKRKRKRKPKKKSTTKKRKKPSKKKRCKSKVSINKRSLELSKILKKL